jgi:hypothetical protein
MAELGVGVGVGVGGALRASEAIVERVYVWHWAR